MCLACQTLTSTAPIGSPIIWTWAPTGICKQWEKNLTTRLSRRSWGRNRSDEPLRKSAWKAIILLTWLRWLNWISLGGYLPSLSINYVGMSKDMEKKLPQLYYIKVKISMIWVLLQSESPWQCNDAIFHLSLCFSVPGVFWRNRLREYVPTIIVSIMAKFKQILWERFRNILTHSFNNRKNSEIACNPHNSLIF